MTIKKRWVEELSGRKQTVCECECECGNLKILRSSSLKDKRWKKCCDLCGSRQGRRNLFKVGERYGKLVIIRRWTEYKVGQKVCKSQTMCECKCDCGNIIKVWSRYISNGHKLSCGCLQKTCGSDNPNWKGHGQISSSQWASIKGGSKRKSKKIEFNLTIEEVWGLFLKQSGKCAISGVPIEFSKKNPRYKDAEGNTASLDRIDSSKGYIIDNVQWVHKHVNQMKWSFSQEEFIKWCQIITENQIKRS